MRQYLLLTLLLAGAGCQGFHDRLACRKGVHECAPADSCAPVGKKCAPVEKKCAPEKPAAPAADLSAPARAPAISQDVLLVPKMVYMPYVAQSPTVPVRLTSSANVVPQENVGEPRKVGETPDEKTIKKLLDRIESLEECLKQRIVCPPTMICPPSAPVCPTPLFRRPLFPRCEPLFQRCEPLPSCEPAEERINIPLPMQPGTSSKMPAGTSIAPQRPLVID